MYIYIHIYIILVEKRGPFSIGDTKKLIYMGKNLYEINNITIVKDQYNNDINKVKFYFP